MLLTACADTEAALDAINQVGLDYYFLKPWDGLFLKPWDGLQGGGAGTRTPDPLVPAVLLPQVALDHAQHR
ncbi:MAG: hypothetical protein FJ314_11060, partial [SAR202 cluster bacterium]|nr:hypothetical protein [SAR202 cluster bacterium]